MTALIFLIVLSVLVLSHELGHFLAARRAGIKVEEFGFGYPPRAWGKKIGETLYSINWLPLGGFVKLYGEDLAAAEKAKSKDTFWAKSKAARTSVILSGVVANFLLAIVCFAGVYTYLGIPTKTETLHVVGIIPGSPAEKAGLQENDIVVKFNDAKITSSDQFMSLTNENKGKEVKLEVNRQDQTVEIPVTVRANPPEGEGPIGVIISDTEVKKYPLWQMPFRGTVEGFKEAVGWGKLILSSLKTMFTSLVFRGQVPKDVSGPIGIYQATGIVAKTGLISLVQFIGILSLNLAIVNILPFPALDGGRLTFIIYELITGRRPKPSFEQKINTYGMAALLFLILLVTFNDLTRLVDLPGLVDKILP